MSNYLFIDLLHNNNRAAIIILSLYILSTSLMWNKLGSCMMAQRFVGGQGRLGGHQKEGMQA
jgi:hypothetical protein